MGRELVRVERVLLTENGTPARDAPDRAGICGPFGEPKTQRVNRTGPRGSSWQLARSPLVGALIGESCIWLVFGID